MGRLIARLIAAQDGWATPLGDFNHRWLSALFRPIRPLKDFLNGVWLGHPLHAAATDIPIGTLLLVVILDLLNQPAAADVALVATILFMLAAAVTGAADYADTDGTARVRATLHSTLMVVALLLLLISLALRAGAPGRPDHPDRAVADRLPDRDRRRLRRRAMSSTSSATWSAATRSVAPGRNGSSSTPAT